MRKKIIIAFIFLISVFTITGCKNSNTSKNINDLISSSDILNWELVYKEISNNKAKAEDYEGKSFIFTGIIQNIEEDYCVLKDMQSDHTLNVYLEKQVLKSLEPKKQIYIIGTLKNTSSIDNPDLVDSVKLNNDDIKKYLILDKSKISSSSYGPNSSFSNYEYFTNNSNIVIKCKESGDYSGTLTKTYDKSMNLQETLLEKILYDDEKKVYTYDEKGNVLTEDVITIKDGNETKKQHWDYTYEYNDKNQVSKKTGVNTLGDNYTIIYEYTYDENNLVKEEIQTSRNSTYKVTYEYDELGNEIKHTSQRIDKKGTTSTTTTTYIVVGKK